MIGNVAAVHLVSFEQLHANTERIANFRRQRHALVRRRSGKLGFDQVKGRLEPRIDRGLFPGLQIPEAEIQDDGNGQEATDEQQVRAKEQSAVAILEHYSSQASGTSR
jgi:hypothetical protein